MLASGISSPAWSQDLSVEEIVERSNRVAYYQGASGRSQISMVIRDKQGQERTREFTILRWNAPGEVEGMDPCGDQKFYVYFQRPADVNKMAFLVWKHLKKEDDRWLYLPALDLVKRISSADKRTSFAGSDFFYEDVSGRNIEEDVHELLETNETFYVLKNTPKDPAGVEFSYYKMWVHKDTFVTVQVEFFDKKGDLYRQYNATKVEDVQGFKTVTQASMKDLRTGGETINEYRDVQYDIEIPEDIFTERYLRRAPTRYLR